jgi:predicted Zn finger-like uncharacterized protein
MSYFSRSRNFEVRPAEPVTRPTRCPACQSVAITSTAKVPNASSYWRCEGCGEVWNVSRRSDPVDSWRGRNWR